jgi:PPK2 family polyphosphate:nucleotide phosphotransferase
MKSLRKIVESLRVPPGKTVKLARRDTAWTAGINPKASRKLLEEGIEALAELQNRLYAQNTYSVLIIFQAMDAAGKDSTIRHVMSGVNPQGCQVFSFKAPSAEERDHTYLWRSMKALPERGRIGIHNRSYYEEVLIARVHPEILAGQQLPPKVKENPKIWQERFTQIANFERYLTQNGMVILKFFLHVSKEEQRQRFLSRIDDPGKNWKFSMGDLSERPLWDQYMRAYEDAIGNTSTADAPWFIVPADNKWFMRLAVAAAIVQTLEALDLKYPEVAGAKRLELEDARRELMAEK